MNALVPLGDQGALAYFAERGVRDLELHRAGGNGERHGDVVGAGVDRSVDDQRLSQRGGRQQQQKDETHSPQCLPLRLRRSSGLLRTVTRLRPGAGDGGVDASAHVPAGGDGDAARARTTLSTRASRA